MNGQLVVVLQIVGDLFQIAFAETYTAYGDGPVWLYEKNCRDVGESICIRNGIGVRVDQSKKGDPALFVELVRVTRIVLGYPDHGDVCVPKALMKPLEKRESKLAYGAGDLKEGQNGRAPRQQILQRMLFAMKGLKPEFWRKISIYQVRHLFVPAKPLYDFLLEAHFAKNTACKSGQGKENGLAGRKKQPLAVEGATLFRGKKHRRRIRENANPPETDLRGIGALHRGAGY